MLNPMMLDADRAMLLVIDMQVKLLPHIEQAADVLSAAAQLIRGARVFGLPVLATAQYVDGLGPTHPAIGEWLTASGVAPIEKMTFSACDETVREALRRIDRPQVILTGIEAHVCVQQTALDLVSTGHDVFVCADAVGSRHALDCRTALSRMRTAGATVTTVEAALFELCHESGTDRFKQLLRVIKEPQRITP